MKIVDLKDMPGANLSVPNGMDSVGLGRVVLRGNRGGRRTPFTPHCVTHGAMNKVSQDGIWRCLQHGCHVGCYQVNIKS